MLFQRCFNVGHRLCINVVERGKSDVGFCFIFNVGCVIAYIILPEVYSELYQRTKIECFTRIVNPKKPTLMMFDRILNTLLYAEIYFFTYFYYFKLAHLDSKEGRCVVTTYQAFSSSLIPYCSREAYLETCQSIYDGPFRRKVLPSAE